MIAARIGTPTTHGCGVVDLDDPEDRRHRSKRVRLYVLADRLDDDPWLLLLWRGCTRDELPAHLGAGVDIRAEVAPWWPLVPGAVLPGAAGLGDPWLDVDPCAVLTRLGPLDVEVRCCPVTDLLTPAYEALVQGG